jgi:hypothetical protein
VRVRRQHPSAAKSREEEIVARLEIERATKLTAAKLRGAARACRGRAPRAPWKPGQSGNPYDRPKGSRNKLSEEFIQALAADFEEHGRAVIRQVRETKPEVYLKVVASLLPKDVNLNTNPYADLSDEQLMERLDRLDRETAPSLVSSSVAGRTEPPGPDAGEEAEMTRQPDAPAWAVALRLANAAQRCRARRKRDGEPDIRTPGVFPAQNCQFSLESS